MSEYVSLGAAEDGAAKTAKGDYPFTFTVDPGEAWIIWGDKKPLPATVKVPQGLDPRVDAFTKKGVLFGLSGGALLLISGAFMLGRLSKRK